MGEFVRTALDTCLETMLAMRGQPTWSPVSLLFTGRPGADSARGVTMLPAHAWRVERMCRSVGLTPAQPWAGLLIDYGARAVYTVSRVLSVFCLVQRSLSRL